jgi:hypothetical protein
MFHFYGGIQPFIFLIVLLIIGTIVYILITLDPQFEFLYVIINLIVWASLAWGIYPALVKREKFFVKRGYSNVALEYIFIKKFLLILIPLMILLNLSLLEVEGSEVDNVEFSEDYYILLRLDILLSFIILAAFIRLITQVGKEDFRFYFAKGCCNIISEKKDNFEKMKYIFPLLSSYNKYLERHLKIKKDINKIYSIILSKDIKERDQITKSICNSLQGDKLNLAKYLLSLHQIPDSEYYIKESLIDQLRVIGVFLAAAIPIII